MATGPTDFTCRQLWMTAFVTAAWLLAILAGCEDHESELAVTQQPEAKELTWQESMPVTLNGVTSYSFGGVPEELGPEVDRYWHYETKQASGAIRRTWKPSWFFEDPRTIELCVAIFDVDLEKMTHLIDAGINVNTVGKCGMTPLYWAFHQDTDPRPFEMLLKAGADPNIVVNLSPLHRERPKQVPEALEENMSVGHATCKGMYNRQFKNVIEHGADMNLAGPLYYHGPRTGAPKTPFFFCWHFAPDAGERYKLIASKWDFFELAKANGVVPQRYFRHIHLLGFCRNLIERGLDTRSWHLEKDKLYYQPIHYLATLEPTEDWSDEELLNYEQLADWFNEQDVSLKDAKEDLKRWSKWLDTGRQDLVEKEHQERTTTR